MRPREAGTPRDLNLCQQKWARRPSGIYTGIELGGRMARQPIRTLPPEVWEEFMAALKRGPTPEQARAMERTRELGRSITLKDSSIVRKKRVCRPPA